MNSKYDIVVIGSGIGGLVSAALLAELNKKILIVEKEPHAGGYLTAFKSKNFVFDISLHLLNGCRKEEYVYNIFKNCHIIDDIKFIRPKYLYRSIFPDFDLRVPQMNLKEYTELLINLFPNSAKDIKNLFDEMSTIFHEVNNHTPHKDLSPLVFSYLKHNYENIINKYIKDIKLKAIICQLWMYFGLPPSMLRAMDFCYPWFDYMNNGGYYPENGGSKIAETLLNYIKSKGGDFLFNTSVDKLLVSDNRCQGISFDKNVVLSDITISNADLKTTVYSLIGKQNLSTTSMKKIENIEPSISAFEVFLGLNIDLYDSCHDEYEIFINSDYDMDKQYQASQYNCAETAPFIMTVHSNIDKSSAPKGKSVVTIIMLSGYDYWVSKSKNEYQDAKQRIAEILINRANKVIPEISSNILEKIIVTPLTFERYTNNSRGAIYGYSRTIDGNIEVRPNEINKVKNLYFASAWVKQGSGIAKVLYSADSITKKILNSITI